MTASLEENLTPMMQQWHLCKQQAKEALLFFRLGDFYEAFFDDANLISKELHLTLTQRQKIPMCGVPFHTCEVYIDKLLAKGYKVAIAEQTEDPKKAKGLVKREITRIVSPATIVNSHLLQEKANNFFVSISQVGTIFGLAILDITTAEMKVIEVDKKKQLVDELYRLRPAEILLSKKWKNDNASLLEDLSYTFSFISNEKDDWFFDPQLTTETLLSHFHVQNLDGFGLKGMTAAVQAAGALFSHLHDEMHFDLSHIKQMKTDNLSSYMSIDYICMRNLEIFDSFSSDKKNTLLSLLDKTVTPMGGRLLAEWLKHPLLDKKMIELRQESIEEIKNDFLLIDVLQKHLDKIRDLERLIMKISSNFASPKDLVALRFSLEEVPLLKNALSSCKTPLLQQSLSSLFVLSDVSNLIKTALVDQPPFRVSDGDLFKEHYNAELDELREISKNSKSWIANYQNTLREETKIKTLKVGFTRAFGYYIEISKGQLDKIPSSFSRRQTLVNAERFLTPELKEFEQKIFTAEEKIQALESDLFNSLRLQIAEHAEKILVVAGSVAVIDVLFSLAKIAKEYRYVKPMIDESDAIAIKEGRHPMIENSRSLSKFIPNDTYLDNQTNQLFIITGPNMAGKSTYIRQTALIVIMAQMGSFVPASEARIGIVDKVFSRIGASDDLSRGQSTFMVEMSETANILHNATSRSLVILDEIGRGTSTYDGISIAWAVAEFLLTTEGKRAKTLFATHYWELTELEKTFQGVVNYNVAVQETPSGIVFLRKIIKGGTDKSYGIHVAKLAGLPFSAIQKAEERLKILEKQQPRKKKENNQITFFDEAAQLRQELMDVKTKVLSLDLERLSPLEACSQFFALQKWISGR